MGYVERIRPSGLDTRGTDTTILPILLAASMSVGPAWERAHLLVDSGSEHPPLISQSLADWMGLHGPLAGGATQANGDYLPLYDAGQLHLGLNGKPVTENFCLLHYLIMISYWVSRGSRPIRGLWIKHMVSCGSGLPREFRKCPSTPYLIHKMANRGRHWMDIHRILVPWIRYTQ